MTDINDLIRDVLDTDEGTVAYLRQWWLSDVMDALVSVRLRVGLTQREVAERMGTTQSAIARMERCDDGGVSLRRYVDYAVACGVLPGAVVMASVEKRRQQALNATLRVAAAEQAGAGEGDGE